MNKIKLSIIIPCFNSFHLMERALKMFSRNKEEFFEIIVIDDCSTDDSYNNLLKYKDNAKYRFCVFRNEKNKGPGFSRNQGIKMAAGDYITFLDSDDYFEQDYFKYVIPKLDCINDCIIYDFKTRYNSGRELRYSSFFKEINQEAIDPKEATAFIRGTTCGKVYRKKIIEETGIRFLEQNRCEDIPFTKCIISYCNKITYIKKALYVYVLHEKSLIHDNGYTKTTNSRRAYQYIDCHLNPVMTEEKKVIFAVEYLDAVAIIEAQIRRKKEWLKIVREVEAECKDYFRNEYLAEYAITKRIELMMIHCKAYYLLKTYHKIKQKVK